MREGEGNEGERKEGGMEEGREGGRGRKRSIMYCYNVLHC